MFRWVIQILYGEIRKHAANVLAKIDMERIWKRYEVYLSQCSEEAPPPRAINDITGSYGEKYFGSQMLKSGFHLVNT